MKNRLIFFLDETSLVFKNSFANIIVVLLSSIIPIFIIPYLIAKLGIDAYGFYVFGLASVALMAGVFDFGISIWAGAYIAKKRSSIKKTFASIFWIRILIFIITLPLFIFYSNSTLQYSEYSIEIMLFSFILLSHLLKINWLFQGIQKIYFFSLINLLSQFIFLLLIFLFIDSSENLKYLILFYFFSHVLNILLSYTYAHKNNYLSFEINLNRIRNYLARSLHFFISRIFVSVYVNSGTVIIGLFSSPHIIAIYSVAEQIFNGMKMIFSQFINAFIPYMSKNLNFKIYRYFLLFLILLIISFSFFIFNLLDYLSIFFFDKINYQYNSFMTLFLFALIVNIPGVFLGYPLMIPTNNSRIANNSVIFGSILFIALVSISLIFNFFSASLLIIFLLFSETLVLLIRFFCAKKYLFGNF